MPGEEINTTLRFDADITDLKAAMQEATRYTKRANSEFKEVAAGLDDWASSTDGLKAKLDQLATVHQAQERGLDALKTAYQKVVEEQGKNSAAAIDLETRINNQQAAINKTTKEHENFSEKLKEVEEAERRAAASGRTVEEELEDMRKAAEKSAEGWTVLKDVIADMVSNTINWAIDSFKELMTASSSALSDLSAKTGATTEQMRAYDDVMKEIYRNNYGESFDDVGEAMSKVVQTFGDLDKASLRNITEKAITLRDTFDMDYQESLRAVNSMMDQFGITADEAFNLIAQGAQQGLNQNDDLLDTINEYSVQFKNAGYSADDMFNMLKNGTEQGTWSVDKLGDAMKEYGLRAKDTSDATYDAFAALGYDTGTITQNIGEITEEIETLEKNLKYAKMEQEGFNEKTSELTRMKNAEKIEEYSKQLEGAKGTLAALKEAQDNAGESAGAWQDRFAAGGETAKQATQELIDKIIAIEDPIQQQAIGVQFFGTMWEDLGAGAVKALTDTEGGINSATDAMTRMQEVKYDNLSDALGGLGRVIQSDLIQPIVDTLEPIARDFVTWLIDNMNIVQPIIVGVAVALGVMAAAFAISGTISAVQKAFALLNTTMLANPIVAIVALIVGLGAALVTAYKKSETFRNVVDKVWAALKKNGAAAVEWVITKFKSLVDWFKKLPTNISNAVSGAVGKITTWGKNIYNAAKTKVTETVSGVTSWFKELPGKIASAISGAIDRVVSWGSSLASKGKQAASKLVSAVVDTVKSLPGKMVSIGSDLAAGVWQGMSNSLSWIKDKIRGWVGNVKDFLLNLFDINSPSGWARDALGFNIGAGAGVGVEKSLGLVKKSMGKLKKTMSETMGITPGAPNAPVSMAAAGGKTIIFNQTNNSPRALSRREVYRQTHNALAFGGGM